MTPPTMSAGLPNKSPTAPPTAPPPTPTRHLTSPHPQIHIKPVTILVPDIRLIVQRKPKKTATNCTGHTVMQQLLPVVLCLMSFATVFSVLIVYMDTTEIRHQQFRLNMSRDYDLYGVPQDDPSLLKFIREIHMKKYPMAFMKNLPVHHVNFSERNDLAPKMAKYIANLVDKKENGIFVQSLTGGSELLMPAPWLSETLQWGGLIVEPEPKKYFNLRKENVHRANVQIVHACLSPNGYPREVTLHPEEQSEVKINSLLYDEETAWFNSRVKCFPLFTLMLAVNHTQIDLLSLGNQGLDLQILETVPFEKVEIKVISIHLDDYFKHAVIDEEEAEEYPKNITRFLTSKSYKLVKTLDHNYIYSLNSKTVNLKFV